MMSFNFKYFQEICQAVWELFIVDFRKPEPQVWYNKIIRWHKILPLDFYGTVLFYYTAIIGTNRISNLYNLIFPLNFITSLKVEF